MSAEAFAFEKRPHRAAWVDTDRPWTTAEIASALANAAIAIAIVFTFYNSFWWAPDEGAYAYIADRLVRGDVLNGNVQDVHGGYVHFLHALAFGVFGRDFVSLRYPLALLTVVQSCIVFTLLRPSMGAAAIAGGLAMAALTFVQFLNPTPNWYALFLTVVTIALLAAGVQRSRLGVAAIGYLIVGIFLFRQLSGVMVGIGVVAYLLLGDSDGAAKRDARPMAARIIVAAMAIGLSAYLWLKADPVSFTLYGTFPLAVLAVVGMRTRVPNRQAAEMVAALSAGGVVAVLPLFLYHLSHGSLGPWLDDTVVSAISLSDLDFFAQATYTHALALAAKGIVGDPVAVLNGGFWLLILLSPLTLGISVIRALLRNHGVIHPLPFVALFYALVSVHYAIPIYALYPAGLTFAGLLGIAHFQMPRAVAIAATLFAVGVGLGFQAAQPLSRGLEGIIRGERVALDANGLASAHIRIEKQDQAIYLDLIAFIEKNSARDDTILGLPMTPELYFLSERRSPVRFVIGPLGLRSDRDVEETWRRLEAAMPVVVIFKPDDKYTTRTVRKLMDLLKARYRMCKTVGPFELYTPICRT